MSQIHTLAPCLLQFSTPAIDWSIDWSILVRDPGIYFILYHTTGTLSLCLGFQILRTSLRVLRDLRDLRDLQMAV